MNKQPTPPTPPKPTAPTVPLQPAMAPAGMGMPPVRPNGGNKTGLIVGIISGVIALILLIVGIIVAFVVLSKPSTKDYAAAAQELNKVTESYNKASSSFTYYSTSSSQSAAQAQAKAATLSETRKAINDGIDRLSKMRAVTGDNDVKERFEKLKGKQVAFNEAIDGLIEAYSKIAPAFDTSLLRLSSSEDALSPVRTMRTKLEGVKNDIKNQYNKQFVADITTALKSYENAIEKYVAMRSSGHYDSSAYSEYSAAYRKINTIANEWALNMRASGERGEVRTELNSVVSILNRKQFQR